MEFGHEFYEWWAGLSRPTRLVVAGVMFSGKSEELIRRVRRAVIAKKRVQVFKSHLDARYAGLDLNFLS